MEPNNINLELEYDKENIDDMVLAWNQLVLLKNKLARHEEQVKNHILKFLTKRNWSEYDYQTIKVRINKYTKKYINQELLQRCVREQDYHKIVSLVSESELQLINPEYRKKTRKEFGF